MKQKLSWILMVCTLCLLSVTACINHEPECDVCDEQPEGRGIWLSFLVDEEAQTRSTLQSSEIDYKDVKEVYLYVFEGNTADATCVLAAPVGWKGEITQKHWISADLKPNVEHTFLAVGVDDNAEDVYGFSYNVVANQTKLGECMAELQTGKGKEDMAHAQFFVGTTAKQVAGDVVEVALTLRRKVAGILVYLRNIPVQVPYANEKCKVQALEVRLSQPQPTSLKLYKAGTAPVFGEGSLAQSEVLALLDLTDPSVSGFKPDAEGRYFIKKGSESVLDNSYLMGAYVLPMKAVNQSGTLSINLRGDYTDGSGNVEKNIVLKTYEVRYKDPKTGTLSTDFAIKENTLYAVGKKLSNQTTNGDKPADLSGNLLILDVVPWKPIKVDNTFPTVTGPARMEADFNDQNFVMDAVSNSLVINIKPAVDKNPEVKKIWKLSVDYTAGNAAYPSENPTDWIHFENCNDQGQFVEYTNVLTGDGEQEVKVLINDYAVQRTLERNRYYTLDDIKKFKNDIRRAHLKLETEGVSEPFLLQVQQYNTLTIRCISDCEIYRGISRLDYGCSFDKQTGELTGRGEECKIDWGYFKTGNLYVSGDNPMNYDDGEDTSDKCYQRWKKGNWASFAYEGSAIQKLTGRFIHLQTDEARKVQDWNPANDDNHGKEKNWYLPAYYEMWGIAETARFDMVSDPTVLEELINMKKEDVYWTSSGDNMIIGDAYITRIGCYEKSEHKDKNNTYYARRMINFNPLEKTKK